MQCGGLAQFNIETAKLQTETLGDTQTETELDWKSHWYRFESN